MVPPRTDRTRLLKALADHVLRSGLNTASLRPMASAAGTSDRMLIYHFGSKEGLIRAVLDHLAAEMAAGLDALVVRERFGSEAALVRHVVDLMRSQTFRPYLRVWLDIVSATAHPDTPHRATARAIVELFVDWIAVRHPDGRDGAAFAFAIIEGCLVLDAAGGAAVVDAALDALERRERG